jgi:DNA-binding transcriptional MerR regulator
MFLLERGGEIVETDDEMEKIRNIVLNVRETEIPGRHSEAFYYAKTAYTAIREISALREEGFSMAAICKVMERDGLLPKDASRNSFRRAFRKELARRDRASKLSISETRKKEPQARSKKSAETDKEKNPVSMEAEKFKELTGSVVDTGTSVIRKLPGGSFDF